MTWNKKSNLIQPILVITFLIRCCFIILLLSTEKLVFSFLPVKRNYISEQLTVNLSALTVNGNKVQTKYFVQKFLASLATYHCSKLFQARKTHFPHCDFPHDHKYSVHWYFSTDTLHRQMIKASRSLGQTCNVPASLHSSEQHIIAGVALLWRHRRTFQTEPLAEYKQ